MGSSVVGLEDVGVFDQDFKFGLLLAKEKLWSVLRLLVEGVLGCPVLGGGISGLW